MHSNHKCTGCSHVATDVTTVIRTFERRPGNVIPALHAVQESAGFLSGQAMEEIADWLGVPLSDVFGTATFYTLFSTKPKGENIVMLCDSPPCHLEGSKGIRKALEQALGITVGETTEDMQFTLEEVSCMGLCGVAPAVMIGRDAYGNLTPEMIPGIIARYRRGEG